MARSAQRVSQQALAAAFGLVFLTGGCALIPDERPTAASLPEAWRDAPMGAEPAAVVNWWTGFNDPALETLVAEGLAQGPSIQLAAARVRESRAFSRQQIAAYLPQLVATGSGQYTQAIEGPGLPASGGGVEDEQMLGSYGAQVSWEVPLFQIAAVGLGSRANVRAAMADERAAQVALAADIAQAYVDLRAAQNSYRSLEVSVANADRLAGILRTSVEAGFAADADAQDARRLAESSRARLPGFAIETRRAEGVLAVLRGYAPGADTELAVETVAREAGVPSLPIQRAPAAPADLVRLRPDVAAAEQRALLAAAGVGAARAAMLPQLNLTGAINVTDNLVGAQLATGLTRVTGTPLISIPLFDWGMRAGAVRERRAQFDQTLIQYRQTVNQAVQEATVSLASLDQGAQRLNSARIAEQAAEATLRGRRAAFDAGLLSLADLLRAEQQTIDARLLRIDAEAAQARAGIAVYRAFGGGPPAVVAEQPRTQPVRAAPQRLPGR